MSRRLVIFDVDGTLVDSQAHIYAAMCRSFAEIGLDAPARDAVRAGIGLSLPQFMQRLSPESSPEEHGRLVDAYKASFVGLRQTAGEDALSPLFPGAREALDALAAHADFTLAVATGKSRRGLDHIFALHNLGGYFASAQVSDTHPSKPHPAMIHAALDETDISPDCAVIIGDTTFDMEMGRGAGIGAIGVAWGYHPSPALLKAGAQEILSDFADLLPALDRLRSLA